MIDSKAKKKKKLTFLKTIFFLEFQHWKNFYFNIQEYILAYFESNFWRIWTKNFENNWILKSFNKKNSPNENLKKEDKIRFKKLYYNIFLTQLLVSEYLKILLKSNFIKIFTQNIIFRSYFNKFEKKRIFSKVNITNF